MLRVAQGRNPDAMLAQTDVHTLPFAGGEFDVALCHNSFPHFADPVRALHEIRRVLAPRGWLLVLHNLPRERVNAIHAAAGGAVADHLLPDAETMRELLVRAGYVDVEVEDSAQRYVARGRRV
jgi:demethylmenaquinone methyltransferase/2-methoxy-6-polyprenyl-1,4-benzoquinol methylase